MPSHEGVDVSLVALGILELQAAILVMPVLFARASLLLSFVSQYFFVSSADPLFTKGPLSLVANGRAS
jgi:hypothetical protein